MSSRNSYRVYGNQSNRLRTVIAKARRYERRAHAEGVSGHWRVRAAQKSVRDVAGRDNPAGKGLGTSGARRCGVSDWNEVVVRAEGFAEAEICRVQRRRIGAWQF